jgi:limonene-1,2-epoxide hydrolase
MVRPGAPEDRRAILGIPLCVIYDVAGDRIIEGRVYFESPALMAQLGMS